MEYLIIALFILAALSFIFLVVSIDAGSGGGAIFWLCSGVASMIVGFLSLGVYNHGTIAEDEVHYKLPLTSLDAGVVYEKGGTVEIDERYLTLIREQGTKEWKAYWFDEALPSNFTKVESSDGSIKYLEYK